MPCCVNFGDNVCILCAVDIADAICGAQIIRSSNHVASEKDTCEGGGM